LPPERLHSYAIQDDLECSVDEESTELDAGDLAEAALVRAGNLLDQLLQRLGSGDCEQISNLVGAARSEVDDAALLVPAIGRFLIVRG
jgi:hypothetical protein